MPTFDKELEDLLNKYSKDAETNTPDFILAHYLKLCLLAWQETQKRLLDYNAL